MVLKNISVVSFFLFFNLNCNIFATNYNISYFESREVRKYLFRMWRDIDESKNCHLHVWTR